MVPDEQETEQCQYECDRTQDEIDVPPSDQVVQRGQGSPGGYRADVPDRYDQTGQDREVLIGEPYRYDPYQRNVDDRVSASVSASVADSVTASVEGASVTASEVSLVSAAQPTMDTIITRQKSNAKIFFIF